MQCNVMQRLQYETNEWLNECYCKEQKMKYFNICEVKLRGAEPHNFCGPCLLHSSIHACYAPMTPLFAKTKWDRRFGALLSIWTLILSLEANKYRRLNKIPWNQGIVIFIYSLGCFWVKTNSPKEVCLRRDGSPKTRGTQRVDVICLIPLWINRSPMTTEMSKPITYEVHEGQKPINTICDEGLD